MKTQMDIPKTTLTYSDIAGNIFPDWDGEVAYVIGGGSSLKGFDFNRLQGGIRVGANYAAIRANCNVLVSLDHRFVRVYQEEIQQYTNSGGFAFLGLPSDMLDRIPAIENAVYCERTRERRLLIRPHELSGTNSGFSAFALAHAFGAKHIYLLGMDHTHRNGESYFYGDYRDIAPPPIDRMKNWYREYEGAKLNPGVQVTNCVGTPRSRLTCFETISLDHLESHAEWH